MDLQYINVGSQALDTGVYSIEDMLARQTNAIDKVAAITCCGSDRWEFALVVNTVETLCQDHDAITRDVVLRQGFADDLLRSAMRIDIRLSQMSTIFNGWNLRICRPKWQFTYSIPRVDSLLVGMLNEGQGFLFVQDPVLPLSAAI